MTLPDPKSKTEVFNYIANWLLEQGCRSMSQYEGMENEGCAYRGKKDDRILACAAGCLIPDDEYLPEFEGSKIYARLLPINSTKKLPGDVLERKGYDNKFLDGLQSVHDSVEPSLWGGGLAAIAERHGIDFDPKPFEEKFPST